MRISDWSSDVCSSDLTRTLSIDDGAIIAHNIPINKGWNMQMTLAAEFYAGTRSKAPVLAIVRIGNGNREQVETIHVINKREARPIAKAMGATPWTFCTARQRAVQGKSVTVRVGPRGRRTNKNNKT